jgi:hypothetical protein
MQTDSALVGILIQETDSLGYITLCQSNGAFPTTASKFAVGCILSDSVGGKIWRNAGTVAVPSWNSIGEVTYAERSSIATATATDDGLTTGLIADGTTFCTITSAGATKAVTLPAIVAAGIGQSIDLYVGANGYELLTPATSGNTINTVDSDGTNQLDVAANTLLRCVQVSATGWACYQVAATTITVVAPDND